ncbi:hypothetical protein V1460_16195 [Streptomyces sp. SCSIO 30461]|uniref:hypothetical protein n=1 Tax=Streptomyces sp. SCSIO 30461 TaxID=3118085 RepID=UPI0030D4DE2C
MAPSRSRSLRPLGRTVPAGTATDDGVNSITVEAVNTAPTIFVLLGKTLAVPVDTRGA